MGVERNLRQEHLHFREGALQEGGLPAKKYEDIFKQNLTTPQTVVCRKDKKETSVPIGAWKCTFPPFSEIIDRQTKRQTDRQAHMKVPIINHDDSFK